MLLIRPRNYRPPHERGTRPVRVEEATEQAEQPVAMPLEDVAEEASGTAAEAPPPPRSPDQITLSLTEKCEAAAEAPETGDPAEPVDQAVPAEPDPAAPVTNSLAEAPYDSEQPASAPEPFHPDLAALTAMLEEALGDRFEAVRPVSIGGMATIFQMRHRVHGGLFALKLLHAHLRDRADVRAAFLREAAVMARLGGHPNAVALVDVLELDATPALLMPYIEGEDLDQMLRRVGRLDREQTLMLAAQVASLLMYAESVGVTHGDLAPGNIRLDPFGQYRLLDFGLSRSTGSTAEDHAPLAGTPAYNSPEQLRGELPDRQSDLYALGAILAEARGGEALFHADTLAELRRRHLAADFTLPEEVLSDPALCALVRSLLATDRKDRMGSSFELAGALAAFGYELSSFARSFEPAALTPPRPRRKRLEAAE